ncbi:MAG: hypothetical protein WBH31_18300 [Promethearchaeia archaeon]
MPTCKICGKTLKNPNSTSHINSKYHQEKLALLPRKPSLGLSSQSIIEQNDFIKFKNSLLNLEKRISIIEKQLKTIRYSSELKIKKKSDLKPRNIQKLEKEIVKFIKQRSSAQQIKGNIALKDLKEIIIKSYNISEKDFEEIILKLYRKQIFDLQPGGSPTEYQLLSPTGKTFYYLIVKR